MRSLGGIPGNELAAAKRAYRPSSPVEHALSLAPQRRDQPGFQTPTVPEGGDLRSALVSSLTSASQEHSGDLTQALGLIQALRQQQATAAQKSSAATATPARKGIAAMPGAAPAPPGHSGGQPFHGSAVGLIKAYARQLGVDPRAALAVASVEGGTSYGAVGDSGSSFGPFQLHVGGALPHGKNAAWANSPAGLLYALRQIAGVARGKRGYAAVDAIVRRFERPAAPGPEVQRAWARY